MLLVGADHASMQVRGADGLALSRAWSRFLAGAWIERMARTFTPRLIALPRYQKAVIVATVDVAMAVFAAWAAIYLRLGQSHWLHGAQLIAVLVPVFLGPPIFFAAGLYRRIFRHSGATDMAAVVRACLVFGLVYAAIYTMAGVRGVPRTVGLIQPVVMLVTMVASRAMALFVLRPASATLGGEAAVNVLIYGAGHTGRQLAVVLRHDPHVRPIGFIDDDPSIHNRTVEGLKIHGPADVGRLIDKYGVTRILLALPTATRFRRRQIVEMLSNFNVDIRTLPGLAELAKGEFSISDIRQVEIEDLLGREPVQPDDALLARDVTGRVVMVTGAGGSIGSELSRQLLMLRPALLLLVEASEFALYAIERELMQLRDQLGAREVQIAPLLALVQSEPQMRPLFAQYRPDTIYHAAAYKHVPLVEANPLRGMENNSLGTFVTASLAQEFSAGSFVLISTDKAVRPTNIMGATKRLAELAVQALATASGTTRFSSVRFGNVLGSSGSVVPVFRDQIEKGGPVTITHPDVTRYFMTIPEAAQLVIQSGAMAEGGDVFLLDMGEPVRIVDLAINMIRLSGLTVCSDSNPEGDIVIRTIGLRPGEKLYEELLIESDALPTRHSRIMRAQEPFFTLAQMQDHFGNLRQLVDTNNVAASVALLSLLVPGYRPAANDPA